MPQGRILVVCTANICRSPMAEHLLASFLDREAPATGLRVTSAGTHARPGHAAAGGMQRIAARWGLDLSSHRSRRVDADLVQAQTLVLTMEDRHRSIVARLAPGVGQRTFTITELDALVSATDAAPGTGLTDRVAAWHAARARLALDAPDVTDPYGGTDGDYQACATQLRDLVQRLGPALAVLP